MGGSNPHVMIRNMLKKVLTNTLARHFSWAGKKAKRNFKDLKLANVIIRKFILYYYTILINYPSEFSSTSILEKIY